MVADGLVDGVMVSADNVVQCGQATVQWIGTTVCLVYLLMPRVVITTYPPHRSYPLSRHVVIARILSSDRPRSHLRIHKYPTGSANDQGPVSLMVGTGGFYANLQPIRTIPDLDGSSTTVLIDQKEGTDLIFQITDSQNKVGYVQNIKVGGGDSSCLSDSGSGSSSAAASSSEAAAPSVVESCMSFSIDPNHEYS
jgi:hypothetical protein